MYWKERRAERHQRTAANTEAEEWTPENGMLTAAMKVNRGNVKQAFRDSIEVGVGRFVWILLADLITEVSFLSLNVGMC